MTYRTMSRQEEAVTSVVDFEKPSDRVKLDVVLLPPKSVEDLLRVL